jgi:hypothetical protein
VAITIARSKNATWPFSHASIVVDIIINMSCRDWGATSTYVIQNILLHIFATCMYTALSYLALTLLYIMYFVRLHFFQLNLDEMSNISLLHCLV